MLRPSPTDQEIKNWVLREHRLKVEAGWIADCKRECGIPVGDVRAFQQARFFPCPPEKRPAIKQAFRYFGLLDGRP
jgi:hypothetical protein